MSRKKPLTSAGSERTFPYQDYWEEIGGRWVTIESLAANAEEYSRYEDLADNFGLKLPCPGKEDFEALVAKFDLASSLADQLAASGWLIAGYYLTPKRKKEVRSGLDAHRERLAAIAVHSRKLYELTMRMTPREREAMQHYRAIAPDVMDRIGPSRKELGRSMHDLPLIADRIARDLAPQPGRPSEQLRDTTIRLAIEAAVSAGLDDLTISRGTRLNEGPHLGGRAGQFLVGLFSLIAPDLKQGSLVPAIERVRRRMTK